MKDKFRKQVEEMVGGGRLEEPPRPELGDLSYPCFELAKETKRSPVVIAKELADTLKPRGLVKEINAFGPYVNFFLDVEKYSEDVLKTVIKRGETYGRGAKKGTIAVEYCHVNTHKAFHIGHARTTCLGESVSRLLDFQGYEVLRFNYQGDIGPHVARCLWGIENLRMKMPRKIKDRGRWLGLVYTNAAKKISDNEKLEDEVKSLTTQLYEGNDEDLMKAWKETREWSLAYFEDIYADLGIKFDRLFFESQFGSSAVEEAKKLVERGFLRESEGAIIADLKEFGLDVAVLVSSEGYPLYHAKDISLAREEFASKPDKVIHVVASEQDFYFRQLFKILGFVEREWFENNQHLSYGTVNLKTGRMSSREGTLVTYDELMDKLRSNALKETKKRTKANLEKISEMVALGALKYDLLKMSNNKTITFDWKEALDFQGNSAPYLQYTHARARSILGKTSSKPAVKGSDLALEKEKQLVKYMASFPSILERSAEDGKPNILANYLHELATSFNEYYQTTPVIKSEVRNSRLALVKAVSIVLKNGLGLLGIEAPDRM